MSHLVTMFRKLCLHSYVTRVCSYATSVLGLARPISSPRAAHAFSNLFCTGKNAKRAHDTVVFATRLRQAKPLPCSPIMPGARHPIVISKVINGTLLCNMMAGFAHPDLTWTRWSGGRTMLSRAKDMQLCAALAARYLSAAFYRGACIKSGGSCALCNMSLEQGQKRRQ